MSEQEYYQSASQLMKAIGESRGVFDATPPLLHDSLTDVRESEKIRILALLLQHTVRNGPKGMSPCARDPQGNRLKDAQIAGMLHLKKQNVGPAIKELIEEGKIAKDKQGGYCVRGDVPPPCLQEEDGKPGRNKSENGNLYKLLPAYIRKRFQQLTKNGQERFLADIKAISDWEDEAHREAFGVIRDQSTQFREYLFASIDVKAKKLERKKGKKAAPKLLDRLKFKPPELQSVQITLDFEFVQNENGHSHKLQTEPVQNGHPLVTEIETEKLASDHPPAQNEQAGQRELEAAIGEAVQRSHLVLVGGKQIDSRTIGNMRSHLDRLSDAHQVKEVLEIVEDKCRQLAKRPQEANDKSWGWIVGVVRSEVKIRVESTGRQSSAEEHRRGEQAAAETKQEIEWKRSKEYVDELVGAYEHPYFRDALGTIAADQEHPQYQYARERLRELSESKSKEAASS